MRTMTVAEVKAQFSALLDEVGKGEEIVVSYGKAREKVAVIVPYSRYAGKDGRQLGLLAGKGSCIIHDDFALSDEELLRQ